MFRTKNFTPLFNTPSFEAKLNKGGGIDETSHLRILETILFPKKEVEVVEKLGEIVSITSKDYPWENPLYTKAEFIEKGSPESFSPLPGISLIINRLRSFPKISYLLGGTTPKPLFMGLPIEGQEFNDRHRRLFGIDCSGLLYYVTEGNVPRNTSDLMNIGKETQMLEPLDLILFTGHVIIYLGDGKVIESREFDGVVISDWSERKTHIKKPYKFIRFHPEAFSQRLSQDESCEYQNPRGVC